MNLTALSALTQEITGFFIIESHVLRTTRNFRNERVIEELWDAVVGRLSLAVEDALKNESEPDVFLRVKECLLGFIMTLEVGWLPFSLSHGEAAPNPTTARVTRILPTNFTRLYLFSSRSMRPFLRHNLVNASMR